MESQPPARKRPRSDADEPEDAMQVSADAPDFQDAIPVSRDETYYRADGDCVIRVKDVLFKVHRYLLVRDSAAFANMFTMPQENDAVSQTVTDKNPVILHDDVSEFRALCWSFYALPTDYMDQADESKVDIGRLASLYLIAHKYQFESHEKFARNLLKTHCSDITNKSERIQEYFVSCPESRLGALMRITFLTEEGSEHSSLGSLLQKVWLFRFEKKPLESISYALDIAEELGQRGFMGKLYYYHLTKPTVDNRIQGSVAYAHPADDLTPNQRLAFYQGHWSLQLYWSSILSASREQFQCPQGQSRHSCNRVWKEFWPEYLMQIAGQRFDPLEFLKSMGTTVATKNKETFREADISCLKQFIADRTRRLENGLADHFLGPISKPHV